MKTANIAIGIGAANLAAELYAEHTIIQDYLLIALGASAFALFQEIKSIDVPKV